MTILSNVDKYNQNEQQQKQQIPIIRKKLVKNEDLEKYYIEVITSFCNDCKYSFEYRKQEKLIVISYPHNVTSEKISNEFNTYGAKYLSKWLNDFFQDDAKKYHIAPQLIIEPNNITNKLNISW